MNNSILAICIATGYNEVGLDNFGWRCNLQYPCFLIGDIIMAKSKPFSIKYDWKDFDNTSELTSFQKHTIKNRYEDLVKTAIQKTINQSVKDRADRRKELNAHKDTTNPFDLDIGGQG